MKFFTIIGMILIGMGLNAKAEICSDPLRNQDTCREMRHLRSQVLELGAQRDLMQVNYPYLNKIGIEIEGITERVIEKMKVEDPTHVGGLLGIQTLTTQMNKASSAGNAESFALANKIQTQCATCHSKDNVTNTGRSWSSIFKNDWSSFYKNCNEYDRNPYRCKSMYGMLSAYSSFFTAFQLGREDYEFTKMGAKEIVRIASDLKAKQMFHGTEAIISKVESDASEVATLAENKDPSVFTKAVAITQTCMQCHADRLNMHSNLVSLKPF